MERAEIILRSCKTIQRELNRLNKLGCTLDLSYHSLKCFDEKVIPEKMKTSPDGDNLDFRNQVVFEFNQQSTV